MSESKNAEQPDTVEDRSLDRLDILAPVMILLISMVGATIHPEHFYPAMSFGLCAILGIHADIKLLFTVIVCGITTYWSLRLPDYTAGALIFGFVAVCVPWLGHAIADRMRQQN